MIRSPAKGLASWVAVPSPEKWRNVIRDRRLSCPCTQNHDLRCTVEGGVEAWRAGALSSHDRSRTDRYRRQPACPGGLGGRFSVTSSIMAAYLTSLTKIPQCYLLLSGSLLLLGMSTVRCVQDEITSGLSHCPRSDTQLNG